jgi:hypothetical protein
MKYITLDGAENGSKGYDSDSMENVKYTVYIPVHQQC